MPQAQSGQTFCYRGNVHEVAHLWGDVALLMFTRARIAPPRRRLRTASRPARSADRGYLKKQ
jgi:hypothetical protein